MDTQASGLKLEEAMQVVGRHADGKLLAGRVGQVGVVLFNQPERRNAMSLEMWDGVHEALGAFAQDRQVRVVVYAGTGGKAFMAGSDISQFAARRSDADANEEFMRLTARAKERVAQFPKPSIACIQGFCIGVGMVVAISADLRVAAPDAQLGITAARMGIHFGLEPTERLVSLVGPSRARLVLYSARRFSAQEALAMGLVDQVAAQDVVRETLELARTIADNAPLSVQASKFTIDQVLKPPAERDLAVLEQHTRRCMDSADYREGRTAFMEKRPPVFTGA